MKFFIILATSIFCLTAQANVYSECARASSDERTKRYCTDNVYSAGVARECGRITAHPRTLRTCFREMTSIRSIRNCNSRAYGHQRELKLRRCFMNSSSHNEVVVEHHTTHTYDYNEYVACYERPRSRIVVVDREQHSRGEGHVAIGILGVIGGQVLGAITGHEEIGDAISVVSAGVAIYGGMEVASSQEIIYEDNGYDCHSYYQLDRRTYRHHRQGQTCTTKRYYTHRWNGTHEYFETTCTSGRTYMTFERNENIWRY